MIIVVLLILLILTLAAAYFLNPPRLSFALEAFRFALPAYPPSLHLSRRPRVVVSFSTIPTRLHLAFESVSREIARQTLQPDRVYACIPRISKRQGIPYPEPPNMFTVVRCDDWGPATKLLGCLSEENHPDTLLITLDDDQQYSPDLIERLVFWANQFPDACVGFSALDCCLGTIRFSGYPESNYIVSPGIYCLEGFAGVAYRRRFVSIEKTLDLPGCFVSDDLVLSRAVVALGGTLLLARGPRPSTKQDIDKFSALHSETGDNERWHAYRTCQQNLLRAELKTQYVHTKAYFLLAHHFDARCFFLREVSRAIDGSRVKENEIIAIRPECLPHFAAHVLPFIKHPFVLITCDSVHAPDPRLARQIVQDRRVSAWFSTAAAPGIPGVRRIPLGVDYFSAYFQVPSVSMAEQETALNAARAAQRHAGVYTGEIHFRVWPHVASFMSTQLDEERASERCEAALLGVHVTGGTTVSRKQLEVEYWRSRFIQFSNA